MTAPEFHRHDAFECGDVTSAAGGDVVAVGTAAGGVEVVSSTGRTHASLDAEVVDVAAGSRVYAATGAELAAISLDGTRIWSREFTDITQIAATDDDAVGVLTGDDRLHCIDGETGAERFVQDRPWADIAKPPTIVGTPDGFLVGVWSFVAHLDTTGETRFEANLDGAFRDVGMVDDCVVVAMRNDRLLGLDAGTGDRRWTTELAATSLVERGSDWTLAATADHTLAVGPDGSTADVDSLPAARWFVATVTGDLVAAIGDGTITAFHAGTTTLSVDFAAPSLVRDHACDLAFEVTNEGDTPGRFDVALAVTNGVLDGPEVHSIDLDAGESESVSVPVTATAATCQVTVRADDRTLATETVDVSEQVTLAPEATVDAIRSGTVDVAVSNLPGTAVSVSAGGDVLASEVTDDTATVSVPWPLDGGLAVATADQRAALDLDLPAFGDVVAVEDVSDGVVPITVTNPVDGRFADDVVVAGSALGREIRRSVSLESGESLQFLLVPPRDGDVTVGLGGRSDRLQTSVSVPGPTPARTDARRRTAKQSSSPDRTSASDDAAAQSEGAGASDGTQSADPAVLDATSGGIRVTRELAEQSPAATVAFRERLVLENDADRRIAGRIETDDDPVEFSPIPAGGRRELHRLHAIDSPGNTRLPDVTVVTNAGETYDTDPIDVTVTEPPVHVTGTLDHGTTPGTFTVDVRNQEDTAVTLERVGIRGLDVWALDGDPLESGEATTHTLEVDAPADRAVRPAAIEYGTDDGAAKRPFLVTPAARDAGDLAVTIGPETQAVERGQVLAVVQNRSDTALTDVTITATGDIDELFYAGSETIERLDPGEEFHHEIRLGKVGDHASLDLRIDHEHGDADYRLAGPVVDDVEDWDPDDREAWTVEDTADDGDALDTHHRTRFSPR